MRTPANPTPRPVAPPARRHAALVRAPNGGLRIQHFDTAAEATKVAHAREWKGRYPWED